VGYFPSYRYFILRKDNEFLAVFVNPNTANELVHFYDQGYLFFCEITASTAQAAVSIVQHNEDAEIFRLQREIQALREENRRLLDEQKRGTFSARFNDHPTSNDLDPLAVLGFSEKPTPGALKKRYQSFIQKFHPDKDGSNLLTQIINKAYEQLGGRKVG
jgi:hypothetical protein